MASRLDQDYNWSVKLFLSVDIAASTAFKARSGLTSSLSWIKTFEDLFEEFPRTLYKFYQSLRTDGLRDVERPRIWKFIGDEIVFVADINDHLEIYTHIIAFVSATNAFEREFKQKHHKLRLKATAWVAGFPVMNSIIRISAGENEIVDYLGPQIDLGFRLSKHADHRRIPVSLELALFLSAARKTSPKQNMVWLGFDGTVTLRGVLQNEPYPLFWVDRLGGEESQEDKLMRVKPSCDHDAIEPYASEYFKENDLPPPFIHGDSDMRFNRIPDGMERLRHRLIEEDIDIQYPEAVSKARRSKSRTKKKSLPQLGRKKKR